MSDFLIELGQNRFGRQLLQNIGIPVPEQLRRATSPMKLKALEGRTVVIGKGPGAELVPTITSILTDAGATVNTDASPTEGQKVDALVFDATGLATLGTRSSSRQARRTASRVRFASSSPSTRHMSTRSRSGSGTRPRRT